ncbi:TonB-linked outer membrane protein, SusC/RagA family [Algoriphagus locisalis]|uniref:TonB-linked outer membrane protein, SusC/RagA family n=1 Tax=Algoriphagus locisalis TaxID=305507 RepID=A0A1I7E822_9BACT|nr:TonB-linked outer membrane protein, SusC/RagA family [Algoriphagus locisalis]
MHGKVTYLKLLILQYRKDSELNKLSTSLKKHFVKQTLQTLGKRWLTLILLICCFLGSAHAQNSGGVLIKGTVTAQEDGLGLPGVNVLIKGTGQGTVTDIDGNYSISVPSSGATLLFTFIGFVSSEVAVNNQTTIDITMAEDTQALDEFVVVGYGEQKKATMTGAISSVGTKELIQSPVSNISNSLVGRLPGLIAVQSSGEPGYDQSSLKIRGIATLNTGAESDPLILVDGVQRSSINLIDPNEIETLSILKDASATAVFGVRGANGVILITTKTGSKGKPTISYTANYGVQSPNSLPEMLNSYDYASLHNEASINSGQSPYFSEESLELYRNGSDPYFHPDVDWFDLVLKDFSAQQQHNFNISGGAENTRYFISLGYFGQDGAYDVDDLATAYSANPKYQRYNLRSNFDIDFNKNFSASVKVGAQFADSNYPGFGAGEIFFRILNSNPLMNPGVLDGRLISGVEGLPSSSGNPLSAIVNNGYQRNFNSTINSNIALKHKLDFVTEGLSVRGMLAYDNYYQHSVRRNKQNETYRIVKDPNDPTEPVFIREGLDAPFSFGESFGRNRKVYLESAIDYARTFGVHSLTAMGLYMQERYTAPGQEYNVPRGYQGFVGRVTYNYKEKYLTEVNMGYNGSENFPEGKRYGFFPSFSLGWILTQEDFMPKDGVLSFFKIRGSYGEVGNDKIGGARFLYLPSVFYPNSGGYNFGNYGSNYQWYAGAQEGRVGNPDVTWERAKKINIGIETGFFNDQLRFNVDVFNENRDNILWYLGTIPALVQADLPPVNIGKVRNHGFELELNYNDNIGEFNYWVKTNYSFAKNNIEYMDEPNRAHPWLQRTGKPVGQYWGLVSDGFYNTAEELNGAPTSAFTAEVRPGDIRYVDQNGDNTIDQNDEVPIGYSNFPQVIYGISFGGDYKGFDFSILFQGADKVSTYIGEMGAWAFDTDWRNATTSHLERWTPERFEQGLPITYPRVELSPTAGKHNYRPSDFWLQDASYIRLKNMEVAYRFQPVLLSKIGVSSLRVFVNGNNLLTWSDMKNYDPEAPAGRGGFYPQMRVYNLGVNVQF